MLREEDNLDGFEGAETGGSENGTNGTNGYKPEQYGREQVRKQSSSQKCQLFEMTYKPFVKIINRLDQHLKAQVLGRITKNKIKP